MGRGAFTSPRFLEIALPGLAYPTSMQPEYCGDDGGMAMENETVGMETFELWDMETGNLVSDYLTEGAALAFVREIIEASGPGAVMTWQLARGVDDIDTEPIARGSDLVSRALGAVA
jgi:hypothetical protein